ncbi:type II secretion system protein [Ampullimonas aquatilis]|uniref:type II secretion system protein n=1 Tax=Ampullimonas aquatilis TaxID=1341549 RepID=UPI003C758973
MPRYSKNRGFSLIELLITVLIIGILATGAAKLVIVDVQREKELQLRIALRQIRTAIDDYKKAAEGKRVEVKSDESGYPKKLNDLAEGVVDIKDPKGKKIYFLRRLPIDPMAPSGISAEASWGTRSSESGPENPQDGKDVFDVYSKSDRVGLNGMPYRDW